MGGEPAVEMRGITKRFAHVIANDGVDFTLGPGEVHALLGENGAGKTTLMRILYGLTALDEGRIRVGGRAVTIGSPKDAIAAGVGMVTQHFSLVGPMSVADNIVLGNTGWRVPPAAARERASDAAERFGIRVDPDAIVDRLSIGERQRVEILKALSRDCSVLVLDEPTAVLAPQEVEALFATIARLAGEGLSVVFISHKLAEVMAITDRVTVMRQGRVVGTVPRAETDERELARMMVGRVASGGPAAGGRSAPGDVLLRVEGLRAQDDDGLPALDGVSLEVRAGEIVGIAGVSGNGQSELSEVLSGMRAPTAGSVEVAGRRLAGESPSAFIAAGVGRIPEDRHASVIAELSVAYNMALEDLGSFVSRGLLDEGRIRTHAEQLIERFDIKARPGDRIRTLSGGNMQKVLLARVLARTPRVLVVSQPTRGLDVGATEYVRRQLLAQRAAGAAVLLVSEDLDEIFEVADRILVMYEGKVRGETDAHVDELERVGLLMAGRSA